MPAFEALPQPSLSRLSDALERAGYIVLIFECRGDQLVIVSLNAAASTATGHSPQAVAGQSLTVLTGPSPDPDALKVLFAAAKENCPHHARLSCRTPLGREVWLDLSIIPFPANERSPALLLAFGRDATPVLRQTEQEAAIRALLGKVFMTVHAPVYIVDDKGRFIMTNARFDQLVGTRHGELIGEVSLKRFASRCHADILALRQKQDTDRDDYVADAVLLTHEGEKAVRLNATMVKNAGASQFRIVHVHVHGAVKPSEPAAVITAAGHIQLIGLHEVRNTFGPRWPDLAERAMNTAEQVVRQRLGPSDTMTRTEDQGFMVYFADATEPEAISRAHAIGQEIRVRLIGQGAPAGVAHVQSVAINASTVGPAASRSDLELALQGRVNRSIGKIQEMARAELRIALAQSDFHLDPVHSPLHDSAIGLVVRLPADVERMINNALGVLPAIETKSVYLDAIRLGFARYSVFEGVSRGATHLVFVTLSNEIFLSAACLTACVEVCRSITANQRQRIVISVAVPEDVPRHQVRAVVDKLRGFCRFVAIMLPTTKAELPDLVSLQVSLITIDWRELGRDIDWQPKATTLSTHLRNDKCRLMVLGAPNHARTILFQTGVDFVSQSEDANDPARSRLLHDDPVAVSAGNAASR